MKKIVKKIFSIIGSVIIVLSFLLASCLIIQKITKKDILPYDVVWVLTDSMEDTIPASSYILIKKVDASEVEVGDVITFYSSDPMIYNQLNTHRIIGIDTDGSFIMKGDNNLIQDNYNCKVENVRGKYIRNLDFLTLIARMFMTRAGLVVVILVIIIGFAIVTINMNSKTKKEKTDEKDEVMKELIAKEVERLKEENNKKEG